MKNEEFINLRAILTRTRFDICDRKAKDYANDEDRLINFKRISRRLQGTVSPELVLLVYMAKHMDAIYSYVAGGCKDNRSEPIQGRIHDAQNYLDLLSGFVNERRKHEEHNQRIKETASKLTKTGS